jgi:hypothetical protein
LANIESINFNLNKYICNTESFNIFHVMIILEYLKYNLLFYKLMSIMAHKKNPKLLMVVALFVCCISFVQGIKFSLEVPGL